MWVCTKGRPIDTTADAGYVISTGHAIDTNQEAGFPVSCGRPIINSKPKGKHTYTLHFANRDSGPG